MALRCARSTRSTAGSASTNRRSRCPKRRAWAFAQSVATSRSSAEPMQPLLIIRAERGQMSAIERRIADFILDNTHLLRDYSSQQLANALGISQSSVVKFSQKLGFKGYPDLKASIGEAVARAGEGGEPESRVRSGDGED